MSGPVLVPAPLARGSRGAVVAPHHLATEAGIGVLRAGGTAVDAAIATNAALAVVMPSSCGIGGDAFWLIWDAADRVLVALNGSGRAAAGVDLAALRASSPDGRMPVRGPEAITVPGAIRSWGDAHARFGRLSRAAVLDPAIELAGGGFPAWPELIGGIERMAAIVAAEVPGPAGSGFDAVFRPHGRAWRAGERIQLPALAATLQRLAGEGFEAYYEGALAKRQAAFLEAAGSPIRARDLADARSTWETPVRAAYRDATVATHPPNSTGVVALEILGILDRLRATAAGGGPDAAWIHLGVEASKLAMADRDEVVGDPAFGEVPVDRLLSAAHLDALAGRIDPERAATPPPTALPSGGGTIYLATVDAAGNAVSLIESNWRGFGSGVVDPVTGIHYHNRGNWFRLEPGHPNTIEPGKRPLHTLLPWMLFRGLVDAGSGGAATGPWVVGGSMGGDAQPQIAAQVISAIVDRGADVATAVAGPRWFVEPADLFEPPIQVRIEPRFAEDVLAELAHRGHPISRTGPFDATFGHAHAIELVDGGPAAGGSLAAATDPRSAGLPAVW